MADDDIVGAIAGALLGLAGIAILATIFDQPKCPRCGKKVTKKVHICPHCGAILEWK